MLVITSIVCLEIFSRDFRSFITTSAAPRPLDPPSALNWGYVGSPVVGI